MLRKLVTVFFFVILSLISVNANASELPKVIVNGSVLSNNMDFAIYSDTLYILPESASNLFNLTLSKDENGVIFTFSNKVRSVTYDSKSGTVNITDRRSFAYSVTENAGLSYVSDSNIYIPLRMLCNSLGIQIQYIDELHSVYIKKESFSVGLFNTDGIAVAVKNGRFGIVNSGGDVLLPLIYDDVSNYDNPSVFKVINDHKCGLASRDGRLVTDIIYNEINYVSPSEIYLTIDNQKGMCDIYGKMIIPVVYEDIAYSGNLIAMVKHNSKWQLLNCSGGFLYDTKYDEVYEITSGIQTDNSMIKGYYAVKNGKWGCIDSFGNTVIDFKYEALDKFDEMGRARVIYKGFFGIIDCGGKEIISPAYDYIYPFGKLNVAVAKLGNNYGAVRHDGSVAIPFKYDYIYPFNDEFSTVAYSDKEFFVINTDGNPVNDKRYRYIEEFKNGMALAYSEGYGYIDHNGNEVIKCIHSDVKQGTAISVFLKKDNKWALYSPDGRNMTGYIYDDAGEFENGLSAVSIESDGNKKYGYVNDSGDIIIPMIYSQAQKFKYGKAIVSQGFAHGIIDIEGNVVIPFDYTGFNPSYDYNVIAAAGKNRKWGLISFTNDILTPFIYDYIFEFTDGFAPVLQNGKYGAVNTAGKIVVPIKYNSADDALYIAKKL